jgi:general secretion pathway protein A
MYAGHFGFSARPFVHGPAEGFFVANPGVGQAASRIRNALTARDQIVLVTGGPGVGKSALVERAADSVEAGLTLLRADLRAIDPDELYRVVAASAGLVSDAPLPVALHAALTHERSLNRRVALVVDVVAVNAELARRLLRLMHLAGDGGAQLNMVLQGPHTLAELLDTPALIHLRQRVTLRQRVRPLTLVETGAYVRDVLGRVTTDMDACMTSNVPAMVYLYVAGVPRLVNTLLDAAFAEACARQQSRVDGELVRQVADQLGWKPLNVPAAALAAGIKPPLPAATAPGKPANTASRPAAAQVLPSPTATLPTSDMTSRLLAPLVKEAKAARPEPEAPVTLAAPDRPVKKLADIGTSSSPGVPAIDPQDPTATGMLRLEDLDDHDAESLFSEDSGHFRALTLSDKPGP